MTQSKMPGYKELLIAAGHECTEDRRSYFFKAVDDLVKSGVITLRICAPGKHWETKEDKKLFNVCVVSHGYRTCAYLEDISTSRVLRVIGRHLLLPEVKAKIVAEVSLHTHCERCNGTGRIPQYHYYCEGICFGCYGTGLSRDKDIVKITK